MPALISCKGVASCRSYTSLDSYLMSVAINVVASRYLWNFVGGNPHQRHYSGTMDFCQSQLLKGYMQACFFGLKTEAE